MKILERQKPFIQPMPFNDALFLNSTAGLVPPAEKEQIEQVFRTPASLSTIRKTSFRGRETSLQDQSADDSSDVRFFVPAGCGSEIS